MEIKDSGTRREFETSAVRDCAEGKGRCDLLPLAQVSAFLHSDVLVSIASFMATGDTQDLEDALVSFCNENNWDNATAILEVAKHYEDGSKKYDERNWEKGIPLHCYVDSAVRHYLKWHRGDTDEPHDRAVIWNLFGAWWTMENLPAMNDLPCATENSNA